MEKKEPVEEDPHFLLEKSFIREYLRSKGHSLESVKELPKQEARQLMIEASMYASAKLAEVETKAKFVQDMQDFLH